MGEERTGTAHTHAPRACLRPQLAISRGATRQRLLYERANAHHLHSPAAFFRAPPPRRSLLRREAPSHSARAAEKFLGTCLAKRILMANWASGKRTSCTRTATNAGRLQRASRQAAAISSVLSSRKGTGCRGQTVAGERLLGAVGKRFLGEGGFNSFPRRLTEDQVHRGGHAQHIARRVRPSPRMPKSREVCLLVG